MKNSFTKAYVILFMICLMPFSLGARTVKWIAPPQYDKINQYRDGIYIYYQGAQVGLMNTVGDKIPGSECDSITPYLNNGFSLLLDNIGGQEATLVGIYNCKSNIVIPAKDGLYKVRTDYAFYSDNRLPVKDANSGKWGYLGIDGNIAIPCQFYRAYPFCKKCAPVRINDKISKYINQNGVIAFTVSFANGNVKYATPFFSDTTAYVFYNGGREIAKINRKGEKISNSDGRDWNKLLTDWLSDYQAHSSKVLASDLNHTMKDFPEVIKNQLEDIITIGNQAIVLLDGKMGILQLVEGDFNLEKPKIKETGKNKNKQTTVELSLDIPEGISCSELTFRIDKGNGQFSEIRHNDYLLSNDSKSITFEIKQISKSTTIRLCIEHQGLILFNEDISVSIKEPQPPGPGPIPKEKCRHCHLVKCPYGGHHPYCGYKPCGKIIDKNHRAKDYCPVDGNIKKHRPNH